MARSTPPASIAPKTRLIPPRMACAAIFGFVDARVEMLTTSLVCIKWLNAADEQMTPPEKITDGVKRGAIASASG